MTALRFVRAAIPATLVFLAAAPLFAGPITSEVTLSMPAQSLVPGTTHTYSSSLGQEVVNLVAVDASRLQPLVPPGYVIVPASMTFGVGRADQGVVAITNYRGMHPLIDGISVMDNDVDINVAIGVAEPAAAAGAGLSFPGAFHLYTVAMYTNDPLYAAVLFADAMPVQYVPEIPYQRNMDDATGVGVVTANVPNLGSPFMTVTTGYGYALAPVRWKRCSGTTPSSGRRRFTSMTFRTESGTRPVRSM
jgi:hypothetical protein